MKLSIPVLILMACWTQIAFSQGTAEDYAFASRLLKDQLKLRPLLNDQINDHWTKNGNFFWYKTRHAETHESPVTTQLWLVDCVQAVRKPLIDLKKFEAELRAKDRDEVIDFANVQDPLLTENGETFKFRYNSLILTWNIASQQLDEMEIVFKGQKPSHPAEEATDKTSKQRRRERNQNKAPTTVEVRDHNLWLKPETGTDAQAIQLTFDGTDQAPYERRVHRSNDGKWLAVTQRHLQPKRQVHFVESSPKDQLQPVLHAFDYIKPGDEIDQVQPHLFDLETNQELKFDQSLLENHWSVDQFQFSEDSAKFRFIVNKRGHQQLLVMQVDLATGEIQTLVNEQSETFIDYAYKQYHHFFDQDNLLIWMSERHGWNHLYGIDTQSGTVRSAITSGEWVVRDVVEADDSRQQLLLCIAGIDSDQDPYYKHYARVNYDGTEFVRLTESNGTHTLHWSPDRRFLIDEWSRIDHPPHFELRDGQTGTLLCDLHTATVGRHSELKSYHDPEPFVAKARDGKTDIYGIIHRPSNFDPQQKYPVIEKIYAGPHGSFVPKAFRAVHWVAELTELGFIVVQIDGMGTSNRSKAFHDVSCKNLGDSGFPDRLLWMQAAAAHEPAMDLTRVGIYGGSAGGQSTLRGLLMHGDFYKAGVADCGCHDNRMDKIWWNELWMGWPVGPHYEEQSNVTQAHRLTGKLLLTVGELDHNVDPASTMQVVDALIKADKDFEFLIVPGADHGAGELPYARRRRQDFFVRHLLGVEPRL